VKRLEWFGKIDSRVEDAAEIITDSLIHPSHRRFATTQNEGSFPSASPTRNPNFGFVPDVARLAIFFNAPAAHRMLCYASKVNL